MNRNAQRQEYFELSHRNESYYKNNNFYQNTYKETVYKEQNTQKR